MADKDKLAKRIRELENYLGQIKELQTIEKASFLSDWKIYYLVDRVLHLTIETIFSIGEMVISEYKFRKPDTYADIPKILQENRVIPEKLSDKLVDLSKFRNVLVHEYLYLDHERVYEHLRSIHIPIKEFLKHIKNFIKKVKQK